MAEVLTSENAAEFYAKKLNLVTEKAPETIEGEAKVIEPEAKEPAAEGDGADKHPISERFSKLTEQRKAAQEDARRERERAERLEREKAELEARLNPPKPELGDKPRRDQFNDQDEYIEALSDWHADKKLAEREEAQRAAQAQRERDRVAKAWTKNVEATKTEIADYDAVLEASDVVVSDQVRDAIIESDVGPKLLYHFAKNPDDAERIAKLTVASALRELGKIEAKLAGGEAKPAKTPVAQVARAAVDPISPLKGANAPVDPPIGSDGKFHGTYAQWKVARKAGRIK